MNYQVTGIRLYPGTEDTYPFLVDGDTTTCFDSGRKTSDNPGFRIDLGESRRVWGVEMSFAPNCDNAVSKKGCE